MMKTQSSKAKIAMPVWISDNELDAVWLQDALKDPSIIRASVEDISNTTRQGDKTKDGATLKVTIARSHHDDNDHEYKHGPLSPPDTMILKQTLNTPKGIQMSQSLGLAREALFCKHLAPQMNKIKELASIPTIYYAHGDMKTGEKVILMEDLSSASPTYVDSGILFGPGNPNNWKRDLNDMIAKAYDNDHRNSPPSAGKVARITFKAIARVHARFWKDASLIHDNSSSYWLRGSNWIQGQGEDAWKASQGYIQDIYQGGIDDKLESWDPLVKAVLDHAMNGISWQAQLRRLNTDESCNWTLVHGDFWPGNVLISTAVTSSNDNNNDNDEILKNDECFEDTGSLRILDWEMVGIGSGPQDLGQYILSNMSIKERRDCEERIVREYWEELVKNGVDRYSLPWEECWREYLIGGVERFLWFLVYFCGQPDGSPLLKWGQFFHDQIAAFLKDHDLKPTDFVQPRP